MDSAYYEKVAQLLQDVQEREARNEAQHAAVQQAIENSRAAMERGGRLTGEKAALLDRQLAEENGRYAMETSALQKERTEIEPLAQKIEAIDQQIASLQPPQLDAIPADREPGQTPSQGLPLLKPEHVPLISDIATVGQGGLQKATGLELYADVIDPVGGGLLSQAAQNFVEAWHIRNDFVAAMAEAHISSPEVDLHNKVMEEVRMADELRWKEAALEEIDTRHALQREALEERQALAADACEQQFERGEVRDADALRDEAKEADDRERRNLEERQASEREPAERALQQARDAAAELQRQQFEELRRQQMEELERRLREQERDRERWNELMR